MKNHRLVAKNILWDMDKDDDTVLPTEITLPFGMTDENKISDYLSDLTGYCHKGYTLKKVKGVID